MPPYINSKTDQGWWLCNEIHIIRQNGYISDQMAEDMKDLLFEWFGQDRGHTNVCWWLTDSENSYEDCQYARVAAALLLSHICIEADG